MRSVISIALVVLLLAAGAQAVLAQQGPGGGPGPVMQEKGGKDMSKESFTDRKARVQKMIEERKTRLEQEKACVDTAKNDDDLMKCRPQRPPMHEGGGMQHGGPMGGQGQQHPPMGGPGGM